MEDGEAGQPFSDALNITIEQSRQVSSDNREQYIQYDYEIIKFLGEGTFGECYKCAISPSQGGQANNAHTGFIVIKTIKFRQSIEVTVEDVNTQYKGKNKMQYQNEVTIMNFIQDYIPNQNRLVNKIFNWKKEVNRTQQSVKMIGVIVMDYCVNRDIAYFQKQIRDNKYSLSDREILYLAKSGLLALQQFHSENFMHRDIKLENMLLDTNFKVKLCDFGLAIKLGTSEQEISDNAGTPVYMAPEIIQKNPYNKLVDVYSLGCAIYKLWFNQFASKDPNYQQRIKSSSEKTDATSSLLLQLIQQMLQKDPKKRKGVSEIIKMITKSKVLLDEKQIKQQLSQKRYPHHISIKRVFHIHNLGYCFLLSNSQTFVYLNKDKELLEICWSVLKFVKNHILKQTEIQVDEATSLTNNQKYQLKVFLIFVRQYPVYFTQVNRNEEYKNYDETYQYEEEKREKKEKEKEEEDVYYRVRITNIRVLTNQFTVIIIKLSNYVVQGFFVPEVNETNLSFNVYINFNYSRRPEHRQKIMMGLTKDRSSTTEVNNFEQALANQDVKEYALCIHRFMSMEYEQQ